LVDTIFRLTNPGDTEASVSNTEKIEFNTGVVPDSTGKLIRTSFRQVSDLNPHPNPSIQGQNIQGSLLGPTEVTIAGYFVNHNNTKGPQNLYNWSVDEDVNDDFRKGRFGLTLSTMGGILSLVPTIGLNGLGYMFSEHECIDVEEPRTEIGFYVKFLLSGKPVNVVAI